MQHKTEHTIKIWKAGNCRVSSGDLHAYPQEIVKWENEEATAACIVFQGSYWPFLGNQKKIDVPANGESEPFIVKQGGKPNDDHTYDPHCVDCDSVTVDSPVLASARIIIR